MTTGRWVGMTLAGALLVTGGAASLPRAASAQAETVHSFAIGAGPVSRSMAEIGRVTGLSVIVIGGGDTEAGAVSGEMTDRAALARALAGTGLSYSFTSPDTVTVTRPGPQAAAEADGLLLEPLVVTASGFAQQISDAPATITVISAEEIESKPFATVADALQKTPGISIEAGGKTGAGTVTMRGLTEDYVLFLVDGKPLGASQEAAYNGWMQGMKTGYLPPPSAIDRIEVIRGPMSSLYGTAAQGGVINIITKPVADVWSGSATLGGTLKQDDRSGNAREGRFQITGPLVADRLGLSFYGSRHDRSEDGFVEGVPQSQRDTLGARLTWTIDDRQDLAFEIGRSAQDLQHSTRSSTINAGTVAIDQTSAGLTHNLRWGEEIEIRTYVTRETVDIENGDLVSYYDSWMANSTTRLRRGAHALAFGLDYRREETEHDPARFAGSISTDLSRWQAALFIEDEISLTDRFALTLGARYDRNENYGGQVTPRIYGVFHMTPDLTIKGGVSRGYKVPALKQADSNIIEPAGRGAGWDQGNTGLEPEESTNFELGMVWDAPAGFQLGLTAYHTDFRNKIDRDYVCFGPVGTQTCEYNGAFRQWIRQYVNRDEATLNGIEATLDVPLGPVDMALNYTFSDSEIDSGPGKGQPLNNLPRQMLNIGFDWEATEALTLWSDLKYKSETNGDGEDRIPGYTIVDVGLDYRFNERATGALGIYNLLDRDVRTETFGKVLDGRRLYVGLTSSF